MDGELGRFTTTTTPTFVTLSVSPTTVLAAAILQAYSISTKNKPSRFIEGKPSDPDRFRKLLVLRGLLLGSPFSGDDHDVLPVFCMIEPQAPPNGGWKRNIVGVETRIDRNVYNMAP